MHLGWDCVCRAAVDLPVVQVVPVVLVAPLTTALRTTDPHIMALGLVAQVARVAQEARVALAVGDRNNKYKNRLISYGIRNLCDISSFVEYIIILLFTVLCCEKNILK
ncbi:hypothetical protein MSG28_008056 [Choristoneura fumiferana]|uniref:Uncharacterized protein n=1 Tax=Choristoneura fumiferana TaxID=7141 RepID=A0ACC0J9S3_CHOFU|nr:hypothetical protein MSG28_008056 [Choristoneura fumiferana]